MEWFKNENVAYLFNWILYRNKLTTTHIDNVGNLQNNVICRKSQLEQIVYKLLNQAKSNCNVQGAYLCGKKQNI